MMISNRGKNGTFFVSIVFFLLGFLGCSSDNVISECSFKQTDIYGVWVNKNINFSSYDDISLESGSLPTIQYKRDSTFLVSELDYRIDGLFWLTCDTLYEYNPNSRTNDTISYGLLYLDSTSLMLTRRLKVGSIDTLELIKDYQGMSEKAKKYYNEFRDTAR